MFSVLNCFFCMSGTTCICIHENKVQFSWLFFVTFWIGKPVFIKYELHLKKNLINTIWFTIIQLMHDLHVCCLLRILMPFVFHIIGSQKPVSVTKLCFFCATSHVSSRRKQGVRGHKRGRWKGSSRELLYAGLFSTYSP